MNSVFSNSLESVAMCSKTNNGTGVNQRFKKNSGLVCDSGNAKGMVKKFATN